MKTLTQKQKILTLMGSRIGEWFLPHDFMRSGLGELFVGYEASARLSELAKEYPEHFESERDGKYMKRRLVRALNG